MPKGKHHGKFGKTTGLMGEGTDVFGLTLTGSQPLRVLCVGAHCDDIEIGCGGTIMTLAESERPIECEWVVFCSDPIREQEARNSAGYFLRNSSQSNVIIKDFRDGFLPYLGYEVKDQFEELKKNINPDVIFTHYGKDKHQDHRLVSELTLNTFRDHLILEYEIPKYDGDLGAPNCFFPVSEANCCDKVQALLRYYATQKAKSWFAEDLFWSLLRLRGMEINSESNFSEAFYCNKMQLSHAF